MYIREETLSVSKNQTDVSTEEEEEHLKEKWKGKRTKGRLAYYDSDRVHDPYRVTNKKKEKKRRGGIIDTESVCVCVYMYKRKEKKKRASKGVSQRLADETDNNNDEGRGSILLLFLPRTIWWRKS